MTGLLGEVASLRPSTTGDSRTTCPAPSTSFGHATIDETAIVEFARHSDPQSVHTDPASSTTGPSGGLIASGVHTIAVCMRLYVDHYISHVASLASPGLDEIRWPRPVKARASRSKPDRGLKTTTTCCRSLR
ncbi:MAG TPA: MaoC/PaaZ C-terminal domain-containing protein [Acidimicrobiales bacterium]|nr:MaoC/PaaZ C-terminal domain-containing protein [Acidimicrobiales bacterium]